MATIIQATSVNNALSAAVTLNSGDYFYQLPNINASTTGASGLRV